ncbi:HNH endonuclease [Streptomyces showdoensis]|uniref:Endonuclease n=1 Tax=Streptomyces showdoensis TaxID=68268 RepID=A0A2P2GTT8_STREW|nr:HNH endonuclease signature motif containing protein [Streptomyces showdoensis]KKZ74335.1 endonuclease [Streptomyces showdoensis]
MSNRGFLSNRQTKRMIRAYVLERDGWQCHYCRQPFADEADVTLDHYIPWSLWRESRPRNIVVACYPCNQLKADALPVTLAWLLLRLAPSLELAA